MLDLSEFFSIQASLLGQVSRPRSRFLRENVDWNSRLLGIVGARGTGKTTLLLQHLAEQDHRHHRHLYVSADHIRLQASGLYEIASYFFRLGGETIMIDEIHKYANWSQEVKNLYDSFPTAKIFFSGSSTLALQKGKADLSRRAVFYTLPGLSFREYLSFAHGLEFQAVSLPELLQNHTIVASKLLKAGPILGRFNDYLDHGVYPFFLEGIDDYLPKLLNVLEKVLYEAPSISGLLSHFDNGLRRRQSSQAYLFAKALHAGQCRCFFNWLQDRHRFTPSYNEYLFSLCHLRKVRGQLGLSLSNIAFYHCQFLL